ncbi:MAG: ECF transporter S component [Promethearchaeota archaeon]|nr:MAG: ECF transporter S component [Candidatus Lokiarchaeota archaeon]
MNFFTDYFPPYQRTMKIVLTSIMTALVCVATLILYIPIPNTPGGYFNVGEVIIYLTAILFGPIIGGLAGGAGAALADVFVAPQYAPGTFIIKFCAGFIIGYFIYTIRLKSWENWKAKVIYLTAFIIGGAVMVLGYFIYEAYIWPVIIGPEAGFIIAVGSLPWNSVQALLSAIVAIPASVAILKGLPELNLKRIDYSKKID